MYIGRSVPLSKLLLTETPPASDTATELPSSQWKWVQAFSKHFPSFKPMKKLIG